MDIYTEVTDRIIAQMENGVIPWQKPWVCASAVVSHATGKPYSILNQMLLGHSGEYITYHQCQQEGGKVRKGEKAQMVVFWKWMNVTDEATQEEKQIPLLRYFNVFHIDQCEGISAKHTECLPQTANPDECAEQIIATYCGKSGVKVIHRQGDKACYQPSVDQIILPQLSQFAETPEYYSTAFHELMHSTGHQSRLDRLNQTAFFGTEAYSKEELVAEIGAAALVNHTGLETAKSLRNSVAYVQNWLRVLKGDKRFIVSAASKAEKAIDLILA